MRNGEAAPGNHRGGAGDPGRDHDDVDARAAVDRVPERPDAGRRGERHGRHRRDGLGAGAQGRYPRWSFYGAAFVSIAAVFASLLLSGAAWMKEAWPTLLIYPSHFMIFMTSRRRPAPARVAWVPIASALILGAATVLSTRIVHS